MRQLVYTMFITNNHALFHLWWDKKVLKYYVHDCLWNFLLFMFLLTAQIVTNSHILAGIYFTFLKKRPGANLKLFWYQIWTSVKRLVKYLSSNRTFSTFCNLVALILNWNCLKNLLVSKIVQKIKFEGDRGELEAKTCFQRQSWARYIRQTLVFMRNSTIWENFNFYLSAFFC